MTKSRVLIMLTLALFAASGLAYSRSNIGRDKAIAKFSPDTQIMNKLAITAPYGYQVLRFSVVPTGHPNQDRRSLTTLAIAAKGLSEAPLFGGIELAANYFPASGGLDSIPLEQPVRLSAEMPPAAMTRQPQTGLEQNFCGTYLLVTRDRSWFDRLDSEVVNWK